MSILDSGYFDWAVKAPGPQARLDFYNSRTPVDVCCHHSAEGWYATYQVQERPERYPTMPHGHVLIDGTLMQHAPIWAATVHGHAANLRGPGWEAEGLRPSEITAAQQGTFRRIHRELSWFTGRTPTRWTGTYPQLPPSIPGILWLVEHRQMGQTECPSERYAPLWAALQAGEEDEEDGMTNDERKRLERLERIVAGNGIDVTGVRITGDAALQFLADDGASLALGQGILQRQMEELIQKGLVTP